MKRSLFFFICIFCLINCFSQNRNNIWYFGNNAGLDFNTNPPISLHDGMMTSYEAASTICDQNGHLLFYTNADTVWNRNHAVMPNGTGFTGGTTSSSTQGALIIPKPCDNNIYYIFTVPEIESGATTFCFSIVDMTLDGGLGAVTYKNYPIHQPVNEKLTAILQANDTSYWILVHEKLTGNILAYSLTTNGLNPNPVISSSGTPGPGDHAGAMKFSHDGTKLCIAFTSLNPPKVFSFDKTTGLASNPYTLSGIFSYGVEFSPDDTKLYTTDASYGNLYQFDMSAGSPTAIQNSRVLITHYTVNMGALKLGPDNRIYINKAYSNFVSVIDQPNQPGLACNYIDNFINLSPAIQRLGFPNNLDRFSNCNQCIATVNATINVNICANQVYQLPSGTIVTTAGIYQDTLRSIQSCDSIITTVNLSVFPVNNVTSSAQICSNENYQLPSGAFVNAAGYYQDTIKSMGTCDSVINTIHLSVSSISSYNFIDSVFDGQSYTLPWGQIVNTPGVYQTVLVNSVGCDSVITAILKLKKEFSECLTLKNAITPNGDGINDCWVLYRYNCFKKLEVNVYNRYGSLVYHSDDYKNDWCGKYKNKELPDGTYYYLIKVISFDGKEHVFKDNVTILR